MTSFHRHPELVSGSIAPRIQKRSGSHSVAAWPLEIERSAQTDKWTLKQVQRDEISG
jgi:hypothetical protein